MLRASPISRDPNYYKELARESNYYNAGGVTGQWLGSGAAALGLEGAVHPAAYERLLKGYAPDGSRALVQLSAGKREHYPGWDLTFTVPGKSFSLFRSLAPPALRQKFEQLNDQALDYAMAYVEEVVARSRCGRGGHRLEPVDLIAAAFPHGTSRLHDPNYHVHIVVFNIGVRRADGHTSALMGRRFFQFEKAIGGLYLTRFAYLMEHELGLPIEHRGDRIEIAGIPESVLRVFSKRRQAIEADMEAHGSSGAIEAQRSALRTRPKKEFIPQEVLFERWAETAREHGFGPEQIAALCQGRQQEPLSQRPEGEIGRLVDGTLRDVGDVAHIDASAERGVLRGDVNSRDLAPSLAETAAEPGYNSPDRDANTSARAPEEAPDFSRSVEGPSESIHSNYADALDLDPETEEEPARDHRRAPGGPSARRPDLEHETADPHGPSLSGEEEIEPDQSPGMDTRPERGRRPSDERPALDPLLQRLLDAALRRAVARATQERSYFSERELVHYLARECERDAPLLERLWRTAYYGTSFRGAMRELRGELEDSPYRLWHAAGDYLEHSADIVALGIARNEPVYTTRELLTIEEQMLEQVERSKRDVHPTGPLLSKLVEWLHQSLSGEQREAYQRITRGHGGIQVVDGISGSGKTQLLQAARQTWEACGYQVIGISLTSRTARELEQTSGIPSISIHHLLLQVDRGILRDVLHHAEQVALKALGLPTITLGERYLTVDRNTVLVLDKAQAPGTRDLARLIALRERTGAQLVLSGDRAHLPYLVAGGGYAAICEHLGIAPLRGPRRQEAAWAREAIRDTADGKAQQALQEYAAHGLLRFFRDHEEALEAVRDTWAAEGVNHPKEHLILTTTRADADALNTMAQEKRLEAGKLGRISITVNGRSIHRNDRVFFLETSRALGIEAGTLGTVIALEPVTRNLLVRMDDGRFVGVPTLRYRKLQPGYAVTAHSGRDLVVGDAYVLMGSRVLDQEVAYTQISRARGVTHLFTDASPFALDKRVSISNAQELGLAVLQRQLEYEQGHEQELSPEL